MNTTSSAQAASRQGLVLIVLAAVLWGTVGVASKAIYESDATNSLSIGFFRLALAAPALLFASWRLLGRRTFQVTLRDFRLMALIGAAMALYQVCYFAAIPQVGVAITVLVSLCTAPVMVALISALLLRERLTLRIAVALVCALIGTGLLVGGQPGNAETHQRLLTGVLLALGAAFSYASITLLSRALAGRYHPLQPITIGFSLGATLLLPFALAGGLVITYSSTGWVLLLHLGLLPTALAYVLFLIGMRSTSATVASIITLLEPLISTGLAWLLFGEQLGPLGFIGAALLLGAISLLYRTEPDQSSGFRVRDSGVSLPQNTKL